MSIDKSKKHLEYLNLLKTVRLVSFPEIDFSKALYLDSLYALDLNKVQSFKALIRSLFYRVPELDIRTSGNPILMLTTIYARKDHDSYWDSMKALFPVKDEIILNDRFTVKEYLEHISLRGIVGRIKSYRMSYRALKIIENKFHRRYLAAKMVTCEKYINEVKESTGNTKVVIVFCDTFLFENVLIQFLQRQGVPSITLQHGQPVFRGQDRDHLNQSQIFNFSSDYYIAKGNYAKRQLIKAGFDEKKIVVLGSLNKTFHKPYSGKRENIFGVFTDCILYDFADYTNRKLIQIAEAASEKMDMSYFIKVHPSEASPDYHNIVSHRCMGIYKQEYSNEELFRRIEFGIMSASAIYLDMLYANVKCYQIRTEIIFPIVESQADIVETCEQLMDRFHAWKRLSAAEKEQYFTEQQREYGSCENTGQRIQDFVASVIDTLNRHGAQV